MAGLGPVRWEDRRICNMDLTALVSGHRDYLNCIDDVLSTVGLPLRAPMLPKKALQQLKCASELEDSIEIASEVLETDIVTTSDTASLSESRKLTSKLDNLSVTIGKNIEK